MSVELLDAAGRHGHPRPSRGIGGGSSRETKGAAIQPIRQGSRRSSRSCVPPARASTGTGSAR